MTENENKLSELEYFNGDDMAADVWRKKYAMASEVNPDDKHRRLAKEFYRIDKKHQDNETRPNTLSEYGRTRKDLTEEDIYNFFKNYKHIIPQGSIMYGLGRGLPVSLSNCFVIDSSKDSYAGIYKTDQEQGQLMKRRGGVGHDISNLRPDGTKVNNSAESSTGAVSFMDRFSNTTREVAMNGRRGALMLSISVKHPDADKFATIKSDRTKVTGANISVKLTDDFMKAVNEDKDFIQTFPIDLDINTHTAFMESLMNDEIDYNVLYDLKYTNDTTYEGCYAKRIKARELWDIIIKQARDNAEPGLMFWDNVMDMSPDSVYDKYRPVSSNPCGEQFLQPYDSCRLIAQNLFGVVVNPFTKDAYIDYDLLYKISYEMQRLGDNLVDLETEYVDNIVDKIMSDPEDDGTKLVELELWEKIRDMAINGRRTGSGITALGDMLAGIGVGYDSDEGIDVIDKVMATIMRANLESMTDMAQERGHFPDWVVEKEYTNGVGNNGFYKMLMENFPEQVEVMNKYGRRNINWSTIAPTGSVSILSGTTSGCEPLFQPYYMRRKKINPADGADVKVDFIDESGDKWREFHVLHPKFKDWMLLNTDVKKVEDLDDDTLKEYFEKSPWYKSIANDIDWVKRVKVQAVLGKYISNAISSTINLPETVTEEEVAEIYMKGWEYGLKGVTVYREGSRSGVLISKDNKNTNETFASHDAPKRPEKLSAESHITSVGGEKFFVIVGLMNNKPYEVFCTTGTGKKGSGNIVKKNKGEYIFEIEDEETGKLYTRLITDGMTDEQAGLSRIISLALRHGADIKYAAEQLLKADGNFQSFNKAVARVLKKYIVDGEKSTMVCESCNSDNVIYEEGCNKCLDCGHSACS